MELQAVLLLLLAYGSFAEANSMRYPALPGVNSRKGSTREARPFHCTNTAKELTTRYETSESVTTKQSEEKLTLTSEPPSNQPLNEESTSDHLVAVSRIRDSSSDHPASERFSQVTSTPFTTSKSTEVLSTDQKIHLRSSEEFTSDQQTHTQLASTLPISPICDCERTCQNSTSCNCTGPETCVCPDGFLMNSTDCVPEQDYGCYYDGGGLVISDGDIYVNDNCSELCTCSNNQLSCDYNYKCSPNATCRVENGVRQCYCDSDYGGKGETCSNLYTDCYDAYQAGHRRHYLFIILPYGWPGSPFYAWCDMTTSGGGWTIIQRRHYRGGFVNKTWQDFKDGFDLGSTSSILWLGNEKIFFLTNQRNYTLRVDLVSSDNSSTYQEYSLFKIENESDYYRLINLGNSSGTAGDGMNGSLGQQFSTMDSDNDGCNDIDCSEKHGDRGWWYSAEWCGECCTNNTETCFQSSNCKKRCTKANLNGGYNSKNLHNGIFWNDINNIKSTEMKIRPVNITVQ